MKTKDTRILNFSIVIAYMLIFILIAGIVEAIARLFSFAVPTGLSLISLGLAETGFSVTVIAVSILTVITNISEKRYFGIKAGEYLKFKRRRFSPGFYDNLVILILIGALQYAALAMSAQFAAAVMFVEIITLLIIQIRWGLGIAFFYYGKRKEIRAFFVDELNTNIATIVNEKSNQGRRERVEHAVETRIDQLFSHTKQAALLRESTELTENLGMLAHVLKMLLASECQSVWHNYETRVDYLLSSLMQDKEQIEYALSALERMLDIVIETMGDDTQDNGIAKNCDFDNARNAANKILSDAETKVIKPMFAQQIFYKLAVVKLYGIENEQRKVLRYGYHIGQFAQCAATSQNASEIAEMISDSIVRLAPVCFLDGRINEAGYYTCLLIEALIKEKIALPNLYQALVDKYFNNKKSEGEFDTNNDENGAKKQMSVYMLMLLEKDTLNIKTLPDMPPFDDANKKAACDMAKFLKKNIDLINCD